MPLRSDWKDVKERWLGKKSPLPPEIVKKISGKGMDLGPSLEKFENAKSFEDRQARLPAVTKAIDGYFSLIDSAASGASGEAARHLKALRQELKEISLMVMAMAQPPAPSGRAKELELVYARNLAGGLRPKWLQPGAIEVQAWVVVDEEYLKLVRNGWVEDAHIQMMKAVQKEVELHTAAFRDTILKIDAKMNGFSAREREAKVKEANEVLRHYKNIVERRINEIVDQVWKERTQRHAYLAKFKKECRVKIGVSAVTVLVGSASAALSLGAAFTNLFAVAKGIYDLAKTLDKMTRDVQETERELAKVLAKTSDLVERRIKAVEKQTGQKIDKMKEAGKELAKGVLGEAHKLFFSTISDAEAVAGEYYGKLTKLEAKRAEMYKRIVEFTDNFPSTPGIAGDEIKKTLHAMHRKFQALQLQYESFDRDLDKRLEKGKRALALVKEAQEFDKAAVWAKKVAFLGGIAAGLSSVANLALFVGTGKELLDVASSALEEIA
jgi:hypothetical protein